MIKYEINSIKYLDDAAKENRSSVEKRLQRIIKHLETGIYPKCRDGINIEVESVDNSYVNENGKSLYMTIYNKDHEKLFAAYINLENKRKFGFIDN